MLPPDTPIDIEKVVKFIFPLDSRIANEACTGSLQTTRYSLASMSWSVASQAKHICDEDYFVNGSLSEFFRNDLSYSSQIDENIIHYESSSLLEDVIDAFEEEISSSPLEEISREQV